jgi:hypothetical protein
MRRIDLTSTLLFLLVVPLFGQPPARLGPTHYDHQLVTTDGKARQESLASAAALVGVPVGAEADHAWPHILGGCRVTFPSRVISSRQSDRCCPLALEAM